MIGDPINTLCEAFPTLNAEKNAHYTKIGFEPRKKVLPTATEPCFNRSGRSDTPLHVMASIIDYVSEGRVYLTGSFSRFVRTTASHF